MTNYKYGVWAGLWFVIGFAIFTAYTDNLPSDGEIVAFFSSMAVIIIGGSILLSRSEKNLLYHNVITAAKVTFIGWLSLVFGIGLLFSPLFDNIGNPTEALLYYFFAGPWLVIFDFLGSIIAMIIHKIRYKKPL